MIYVLLDPNIIIDMVVDRRDNVISGNLLKIFIKLLDYREINLLVPMWSRQKHIAILIQKWIMWGKILSVL